MSVGDKVRHVLSAPDSGDHHCHWPGCPKLCKPAFWGCRKHWFRLPLRLRNRIWETYRLGQEEDKRPSSAYLTVAQEVQDWIAKHGGLA